MIFLILLLRFSFRHQCSDNTSAVNSGYQKISCCDTISDLCRATSPPHAKPKSGYANQVHSQLPCKIAPSGMMQNCQMNKT